MEEANVFFLLKSLEKSLGTFEPRFKKEHLHKSPGVVLGEKTSLVFQSDEHFGVSKNWLSFRKGRMRFGSLRFRFEAHDKKTEAVFGDDSSMAPSNLGPSRAKLKPMPQGTKYTPWKMNDWNLQITHLERKMIFQTSMRTCSSR